jgi:hypothetical protein
VEWSDEVSLDDGDIAHDDETSQLIKLTLAEFGNTHSSLLGTPLPFSF